MLRDIGASKSNNIGETTESILSSITNGFLSPIKFLFNGGKNVEDFKDRRTSDSVTKMSDITNKDNEKKNMVHKEKNSDDEDDNRVNIDADSDEEERKRKVFVKQVEDCTNRTKSKSTTASSDDRMAFVRGLSNSISNYNISKEKVSVLYTDLYSSSIYDVSFVSLVGGFGSFFRQTSTLSTCKSTNNDNNYNNNENTKNTTTTTTTTTSTNTTTATHTTITMDEIEPTEEEELTRNYLGFVFNDDYKEKRLIDCIYILFSQSEEEELKVIYLIVTKTKEFLFLVQHSKQNLENAMFVNHHAKNHTADKSEEDVSDIDPNDGIVKINLKAFSDFMESHEFPLPMNNHFIPTIPPSNSNNTKSQNSTNRVSLINDINLNQQKSVSVDEDSEEETNKCKRNKRIINTIFKNELNSHFTRAFWILNMKNRERGVEHGTTQELNNQLLSSFNKILNASRFSLSEIGGDGNYDEFHSEETKYEKSPNLFSFVKSNINKYLKSRKNADNNSYPADSEDDDDYSSDSSIIEEISGKESQRDIRDRMKIPTENNWIVFIELTQEDKTFWSTLFSWMCQTLYLKPEKISNSPSFSSSPANLSVRYPITNTTTTTMSQECLFNWFITSSRASMFEKFQKLSNNENSEISVVLDSSLYKRYLKESGTYSFYKMERVVKANSKEQPYVNFITNKEQKGKDIYQLLGFSSKSQYKWEKDSTNIL